MKKLYLFKVYAEDGELMGQYEVTADGAQQLFNDIKYYLTQYQPAFTYKPVYKVDVHTESGKLIFSVVDHRPTSKN